ncbi:nitronate monooxygenase family protein [Ferrovibrio sp.]|uniref:NAD(P)H-dependent flavin oxidoreductase n=1 Tax=Ferrovibrio sp. TaxID=1917215 RepID=UPI001B76211C|nr:nitronate monooxygenase family protein [Ferrovibrio sp.]MBP7065297.1 nitronate monooxygenase [Ferrovibrio sp.]
MSVPALLKGRLSLPVIGSPMFIVSTPDLVIAQCKAGVVGSFPALNARPKHVLEEWLTRITGELGDYAAKFPDKPVAPFAVNQIVHHSNDRLMHDMEICVKHKVPMIITSLRAPSEVVQAAHSYGGIVMHDVINVRHAKKALEAGVDGLILVCAGAGGHAGTHSPFALVAEVRSFFDGPIALSGTISNGAQILAAQAMGADFAYIGTRFIATEEANAVPEYKQMLIDSAAADIVYTSLFSGVHGNYLKKSVAATGMDPENLPEADKSKMNFGTEGGGDKKVWRDIWSAGQGTGSIQDVLPVAELVARMKREYDAAKAALVAA